MAQSDMDAEIYRFPEFFDRLEGRGMLRARDAVESETEIDGIVYHHRGVQMPAEGMSYLWNPEGKEDPTFRVEVDGLDGRHGWSVFDATVDWDVFLMLFDGGAVIAWMSDREFETDEADRFQSKAAAIRAGRFSFAAVFLFGPDWVEREEWAFNSTAPALLQLGEGGTATPDTAEEFYELVAGIPEELRPEDGTAPPHLGVLEAGISVES